MSSSRVAYSGLVLAAMGFLLTRFTIAFAAMDDPMVFLFSGLVPLVLGLSLSAYGVVLTVGAYDPASVRTVVRWSLLGTGAMGALVVLTVLGSDPATPMTVDALRSETYFSNFLIGGAVGGTLTGVYAARTRRQRETLRQRANRLTVLNRLLRDQVINAATAITSHTALLRERYHDDSVETIGEQGERVVELIEDVKYLSHTGEGSDVSLRTCDLQASVDRAVETVRSAHPEADCRVDGTDEDVAVQGHTQLSEVFRHLVDNAVRYSDGDPPTVEVSVTATRRTATVTVRDDGPGLPADQRTLLADGEIAEFDDPTTGFGLNIVRLLVESADGGIRVDVDEGGSTVAVTLPRADPDAGADEPASRVTAPEIAGGRLGVTVAAGLAAGVVMGVVLSAAGGLIPVIGALYGIQNPTVGWVTHLFHSVVFALGYVGVVSAAPRSYTTAPLDRVAVGVVFGLGLWVLAAGVVMPVWLRLVGVGAPLPNLPPGSLAAHALWGLTAATVYHAGDRWLAGREVSLPSPGVDLR
jgi:signal transduction histidine kinase